MGASSERRAIHAYVSTEAHDHWHDFAAEQGVSVSAILEALAKELDVDDNTALDSVVMQARRIDATRRRRFRN